MAISSSSFNGENDKLGLGFRRVQISDSSHQDLLLLLLWKLGIRALRRFSFPASPLPGCRNSDHWMINSSFTTIEGDGIFTECNEMEITHEEQENSDPTNFIVEGENTVTKELKPHTKKALLEFRCKVEDAILGNYIFGRSHVSIYKEEGSKERENFTEISIWGIPLLPSKAHEGTDVILLKFLKARDFKVSEAFEMLQKTLIWRKEFKTDGILEENLGSDLENVVYMNSTDKKGHPLCYNIYGAFKDKELYQKTFGTEEKREEFLRWRIQFMEKGIKKLSFKDGGVNSMVQITDLKNSPGPAMKELGAASKKAVLLLQDNYPEFVLRNIFINVPFWYYACHLLFSRILTQRTKSKFIFARPSRVAETLLKFIAPEHIPVQYGGLKREKDDEFSPANKASELIVKGGDIESIQIPVTEPGVTMVWDVTVVGWDVSYKEEFIPDDEGSYKILIEKEKKMGETVRNSFYISEPGKVLLTIDNGTFKKKKVLYRFKTKPTVPMYIFLK
ncbi:hypothetical protein HHK36_026900 [Tetracentron sinense]|uniref:Patellin-4 n=1 Tax=Tetracentron sinense TaxID=13715 RepID=A0A835D5X3_TETSI|nr:hypothetical protein HHK36_026900 [Tetracentron sinense]